MDSSTETLAAHVMASFVKCKTLLASSARDFFAARRRRLAHEREFYRTLRAYCRAHNVSSMCEDDWKTAAYDNTESLQTT
jgi:hypothetical protein